MLFVVVVGVVVFSNKSDAGEENILIYSGDLNNTGLGKWYIYGTPTITVNGDYSQTIVQTTTAGTYAKQKMPENSCIIDEASYVFRGEIKPSAGDWAQLKVQGSQPSTGVYEDIYETTQAKTSPDWVPVTIAFKGNQTGSGFDQGVFYVNGPTAVNTIDVRNLQIATNPGVTLYSTGDSICNYSVDDVTVDSAINYTSYFAFDKNIVDYETGVSGEVLSEIYSRMQTDLASTTYPVIFIEGGMNDINNDLTPLATMQTTMTAMIDLAQTKADLVVVFGIPPNTSNEDVQKQSQYNTWLESECASQGVEFFDMVNVLGSGGGTYGQERDMTYYDATPVTQIHPNAVGHRAIADALISQITLPSSTLYVSDYVMSEGTCVTDTAAPVRSSGSPSGTLSAGTTQATISLTTDENAICKYGTTSGTAYGSIANTFSTTSTTSHSDTVTGLSGGLYNYYVRCQDSVSNQNSDDFTISFTVNSSPTDISLSSASIDSGDPVNTVVGTLSTTDADAGDSHTYSLACTTPGDDDASFNISGSSLRSSEIFNYDTKSSYAICIKTDDGDSGTYDKNFTITVNDSETESSTDTSTSSTESEDDSTDQDVNIHSVEYSATSNSITIEWKTDYDADAHIRYGTDKNMRKEKNDDDMEKKHKVTIKKLSSGTEYFFRIRSKDEYDNSDTSRIYSVTTEEEEKSIISVVGDIIKKDSETEKLDVEVSDQEEVDLTPEEKQKAEEEEKQKKEEQPVSESDSEGADKEGVFESFFGKIADKFEAKKKEMFTAQVFTKESKKYISQIKFKLIGLDGKPLAGVPATLHSDPQTVITDEEGVATFYDVETGEHHIAFANQEKKVTKKVTINEPKTENGEIQAEVIEIKSNNVTWWMKIIMVALVVFVVTTIYFANKYYREREIRTQS